MVVAAGITAIVIGCALFLAARRWTVARTLRIEGADQPVADRVHALQRLQVGVSLASLVVFIGACTGMGPVGTFVDHHRALTILDKIVVVTVLVLVCLLAGAMMFLLPRAVRRSLARVRDVPVRLPDKRARLRAAVVIAVCYGTLIGGGMALVPSHGAGHVIGRMAVYVVALLIFASVLAPLTIVRFQTSPMDARHRDRLVALAERIGVRVRDFRVVKGRGQKVANAVQMGTLPGLRYVLVTDYLLDHLDGDQLDAVIAHELGHARRHHLLVKLGAVLIVLAALESISLAVGARSGGALTALLAVPLVIAFPIGILLVQGLVGVRLETAADDVAMRYVGAEPLAAALEEIGRLNDTKRNTGRGWAILTQHPGLQARLDHLRSSAAERSDSALVSAGATRAERTG